MNGQAITKKEAIQIQLNEYNSLRSEINARISNAYQVLAIAGAAAALGLQYFPGGKFIFIVALSAFACLWSILHNFYRAGIRVQEIEIAINRIAGKKLLSWELECGGLSHNTWLLDLLLAALGLKRNHNNLARNLRRH